MGIVTDIVKKARLIKKMNELIAADGIRAVGTHEISLTESQNGDISYMVILKGDLSETSHSQ